MDRSIRAKFRGDHHVLGPFSATSHPRDPRRRGSARMRFQTTFAMAGRTLPRSADRARAEHARGANGAGARDFAPAVVATAAGSGGLEVLRGRGGGGGPRGAGVADQRVPLRREGPQGRRDAAVGVRNGSCLAAERGKIASLTCLRANGCPWDGGRALPRARGGHLEVLQWARKNGCPWDKITCANAARRGHLEVLQWAHQNGCPWDKMTCEAAAKEGHLEVLQWAHQNGCPWTEGTCNWAAKEGHLEVLQLAHQNGCPWDEGDVLRRGEGRATGGASVVASERMPVG